MTRWAPLLLLGVALPVSDQFSDIPRMPSSTCCRAPADRYPLHRLFLEPPAEDKVQQWVRTCPASSTPAALHKSKGLLTGCLACLPVGAQINIDSDISCICCTCCMTASEVVHSVTRCSWPPLPWPCAGILWVALACTSSKACLTCICMVRPAASCLVQCLTKAPCWHLLFHGCCRLQCEYLQLSAALHAHVSLFPALPSAVLLLVVACPAAHLSRVPCALLVCPASAPAPLPSVCCAALRHCSLLMHKPGALPLQAEV